MNEALKKLCFEYFSGRVDKDSAAEIREFLSGGDSCVEQFRAWESEWKASKCRTYSQIYALNTITAKIRAHRRRKAFAWTSGVVAVAACLVAVFISPDFSFVNSFQNTLCKIETSYCERTKIILPDSTQVWLNSASSLTYDTKSFSGSREVTLTGEAFFDVTHRDGQPFVVNLSTGSITVLGTKFNVSSYPIEHRCEAALVEGKIEFHANGANVEMIPGDRLVYNICDGSLEKTHADVSKNLSWMSNRLDYTDVTLEALLLRLSSIYGTQINYVPKKLKGHKFGVSLSLTEKLNNIMDAISLILPIDWRYDEDGSIVVKEKTNFK